MLKSILGVIWGVLCVLFDILIPRFITEDVALIRDGDDVELLGIADQYDLDEYDGVVAVDCFSWLGFGFFPSFYPDEIRWKNTTPNKPL